MSKIMQSGFMIGSRGVGADHPCFIIAEIGNNHNGSLKLAKQMVDDAVAAKVDAVKFQLRNMDALYGKGRKQNKAAADLGTQYTLDLLDKFQLTTDEMVEVLDYSRKAGVIAFCTPWDVPSLEVLEEHGALLYKTASADLTNHPLLERIAATGKPMICSTGMATEEEIVAAIKLLSAKDAKFAMLHCNSTYPTPFKDVNLNYIQRLKQLTPLVGYSGHERGFHVPIAAVALGAKIVEKHLTVDRAMEGVDHRVSLLPQEFAQMVQCIRDVEAAMGSKAGARTISQGELMNRENLGKSVVMTASLKKGEAFRRDALDVVSPGQGLPPYMIERLVGKPAKRDLATGDVLFPSDLPDAAKLLPRPYKFRRPWGVPVRYHDTRRFLSMVTPEFIEFHLSYGDMVERLDKFLDKTPGVGFTVHAPELFDGDHIVDLCSLDAAYRRKSIDNMRRTVDVAIALKEYFPATKRPFIIATLGGFTTDKPLTREQRLDRYKMMTDGLRQIESPEVEILPQSTAPFPWHMGGQQYQNLFLYPEEIKWYCEEQKYRICLDISHSFLACNHLHFDVESFFNTVAPSTAHLHLGDCSGVDGEGVQIGDGVIDFKQMARIFDKHCPQASFIPEIWQGHKNDGQGFWMALEKLEGTF